MAGASEYVRNISYFSDNQQGAKVLETGEIARYHMRLSVLNPLYMRFTLEQRAAGTKNQDDQPTSSDIPETVLTSPPVL
jgi:hypothetical protein